MRQKSLRLHRASTGLVVVDIQERLLPAIFEQARLIRQVVRLIKGASILRIPIFATEQYKKGLGETAPEIASAIDHFAPLEKVTFSAFRADGFHNALKAKKIIDVLLCGMESHICILQTCLDLLDAGFTVFVVADGISARDPNNTELALKRMHDSGAVIVSTEMVLFELLGHSRAEEFKQVQALVK